MNRRALLKETRKTRETLKPKLAALLKDQEVVMALDGWTDKVSRTYMSTTYAVINKEWKLTAIPPYCLSHEGTTTCGGGPKDARAECDGNLHGL